jgi:hypothetical protein
MTRPAVRITVLRPDGSPAGTFEHGYARAVMQPSGDLLIIRRFQRVLHRYKAGERASFAVDLNPQDGPAPVQGTAP